MPRRKRTFQSTPSAWRETEDGIKAAKADKAFQSTPSAWRETNHGKHEECKQLISIHSLRMEGDRYRKDGITWQYHFNPLPPHGGRQHSNQNILDQLNISIHSLRMEGDRNVNWSFPHSSDISIHSLRMEGDLDQQKTPPKPDISIHSLRMEGDYSSRFHRLFFRSFQSTPSAWRETIH